VGDYLAPGLPAKFDGRHPAGAPAPELGRDTGDVLAEYLHLSPAQITRLTAANTIACGTGKREDAG
jgi:2-methylfumaryl-CoA isomerase